jgi:predicted permease
MAALLSCRPSRRRIHLGHVRRYADRGRVFTCTVGNLPLTAVLWKGSLSFGVVASFIFGNLIIIPIPSIYRKYYGSRMTVFIAVTFYPSLDDVPLCRGSHRPGDVLWLRKSEVFDGICGHGAGRIRSERSQPSLVANRIAAIYVLQPMGHNASIPSKAESDRTTIPVPLDFQPGARASLLIDSCPNLPNSLPLGSVEKRTVRSRGNEIHMHIA